MEHSAKHQDSMTCSANFIERKVEELASHDARACVCVCIDYYIVRRP